MLVRSVLSLCCMSLAASLAACSASPDAHEESDGAQGAVAASSGLPPATCALIAGANNSLPASFVMKASTAMTSGDASLLAFESHVAALGPTHYYALTLDEQVEYTTYFHRWRMMDVSSDATSAVSTLVTQYATVPSVEAGSYHCRYDWTNYVVPPGGARPYVPANVVVYAQARVKGPTQPPNGCNGCKPGI